jgi:hypothetical protein
VLAKSVPDLNNSQLSSLRAGLDLAHSIAFDTKTYHLSSVQASPHPCLATIFRTASQIRLTDPRSNLILTHQLSSAEHCSGNFIEVGEEHAQV